MTTSVADLADYLGAPADDPTVILIHDVATQRVHDYLRPSGVRRCPESVQDLAIRFVARSAWQHWQSQTGVMEFEGAIQPTYIRADIVGGPAQALLVKYRGIPEVG